MSRKTKCGLTLDRWAVLEDLAKGGPMPTIRINHGLVEWFLREKLTVSIQRKSPWSADRGLDIEHQQITAHGMMVLADRPYPQAIQALRDFVARFSG